MAITFNFSLQSSTTSRGLYTVDGDYNGEVRLEIVRGRIWATLYAGAYVSLM